jgi:hypothetical protein
LELEEFNVDYQGNLTLCCQLSGLSGANAGADIIANLRDTTFPAAMERFRRRVTDYLADKRACVERGAFRTLDHFPCWYCVRYLGKTAAPRASQPSSPPSAYGDPDVRRLHV